MDNEEVGPGGSARPRSEESQWKWDYAALPGRGEPRGLKWSGSFGAHSCNLPARAEGKNGSALPPGSHKRPCREWHDDESHASRAPQNVLSRVLVLAPGSPARSSNAVWLIGPGYSGSCLPEA